MLETQKILNEWGLVWTHPQGINPLSLLNKQVMESLGGHIDVATPLEKTRITELILKEAFGKESIIKVGDTKTFLEKINKDNELSWREELAKEIWFQKYFLEKGMLMFWQAGFAEKMIKNFLPEQEKKIDKQIPGYRLRIKFDKDKIHREANRKIEEEMDLFKKEIENSDVHRVLNENIARAVLSDFQQLGKNEKGGTAEC